jgi:hypothetical protein
MIHHIPLDGSQVVTCSVADPYIVLLTEDGNVIIVQLKTDTLGSSARLIPIKPRDRQVGIKHNKSTSNHEALVLTFNSSLRE